MDEICHAMDDWTRLIPGTDTLAMETVLRLSRVLAAIKKEVSKAHASYGLAPGDFDVLATIFRKDAATPTQLAEQLLLSKAGITGRLNNLKKRGLVAEKTSANDKRGKSITLTAEGKTTLLSVLKFHTQAERRILDKLPESQQNSLLELLRAWGQDAHDTSTKDRQ